MPRFFNPEDNPWGMFDGGTTWQQLVSAGDVKRLSKDWFFGRNRGGLQPEVLNCQSTDEFIALANVNFQDTGSLCLLSEANLELAWLLFCNYLKDNSITLTESGRLTYLSGVGEIDLDGELRFEAVNQRGAYGPLLTLNWPVVGQLVNVEDVNRQYPQKQWPLDNRKAVDGFLTEYINYLFDMDQIHRITEIFSSPLEFEDEEGNIVVGLIVANDDALTHIREDSDNDIYQFFLVPSKSIYYGIPPTVAERLNDDVNFAYPNPLTQSDIQEDLVQVVQDLNAQISAFIDECPLDLLSLCEVWFGQLKPEFSIEARQPNLSIITGPASDKAMRAIGTLKDIYAELIIPGIYFTGQTGSDIPLGWSYPITEDDVRSMYWPSSSRGTNLRSLQASQKAVPILNLSLEDIEYLETVFTAIQALQSRLPQLDASIQHQKRRLEQSRARLAELQDTEITRQQVNQAARAARAQVRERIARGISNTEYNIQTALGSIKELQDEKRQLIRQYLNE